VFFSPRIKQTIDASAEYVWCIWWDSAHSILRFINYMGRIVDNHVFLVESDLQIWDHDIHMILERRDGFDQTWQIEAIKKWFHIFVLVLFVFLWGIVEMYEDEFSENDWKKCHWFEKSMDWKRICIENIFSQSIWKNEIQKDSDNISVDNRFSLSIWKIQTQTDSDSIYVENTFSESI